MAMLEGLEQTNLVVRVRAGAGGKAYWDAQWRYRLGPREEWRLKKRRLGLAWQERDASGGWRKRRGRCPKDWLDERAANEAATAAMAGHVKELEEAAAEAARRAAGEWTVRALAHDWLSWLEEVWGAKPSTVKDYRFLLREPGEPFKRGAGTSPGRIMEAFGDRPADEVTPAEVSRFLRALDKEGLTPRNVNKHREVLQSIFTYGCRADTFELPMNPVVGTDKRRQAPSAALDYYEVEEVEALARTCEQGGHREPREILNQAEREARRQEDHQDAEAFRPLFYTGLRLGEILVLRSGDVDLDGCLMFVRRGLSAGVEGLPKGGRPRIVPVPMPAVHALARLGTRDDFAIAEDYVLVNRFGRRLDASALRRRYKRGCRPPDCGRSVCTDWGTPRAAWSRVTLTPSLCATSWAIGSCRLPTATCAPRLARRSSSASTPRLRQRAFPLRPPSDVQRRG